VPFAVVDIVDTVAFFVAVDIVDTVVGTQTLVEQEYMQLQKPALFDLLAQLLVLLAQKPLLRSYLILKLVKIY
jgi:hypothetical protein